MLLQGQDVFVTVHADFGNSLIYQVLPARAALILDGLRKGAHLTARTGCNFWTTVSTSL